MEFPGTGVGLRRALVAALVAAVVISVVFVGFTWVGFLLANGPPDDPAMVLAGVLSGAVVSLAWYAPFLLAVVLVVGSDSGGTSVAAGAAVVFALGVPLAVGSRVLGPFDPSPAALAVPVARVVSFLAVATAVRVAYHGGFERLMEPFEGVSHPLTVLVADASLGAERDIGRALLAALLGGLVGSGGLVLVAVLHERLVAATAGPVIRVGVTPVGIPLEQLPVELAAEASFLLAVLFVVGRTPLRGLSKGLAVVFGVQAPLYLAPALLSPSRTVDLWAPQGPVLAPAVDAVVLAGIAVAVWLAFDGGIETLRDRPPLGTVGRGARRS